MHALEAALGRQRQVDFYEFEASLVYGASYRTARAVTQRNLVSNKQTNKQKQNMLVVVSPPMSTTSLYWCRVGFQSEMTSLLFRRP